jgi:uroporphyrinogen-III synthase
MAQPLEEKLNGRLIALPETRELDLFASLLERRGAKTLRCPLVSILDAPDAAPIEAWLRRCSAGDFDDLILLTGEGLRRLLGFAERAGMREEFVASLGKLRKITRGPKPARALRDLGLRPDIAASVPTTDGIIADLGAHNLKGRCVGVQLYGLEPNQKLIDFLAAAGAVPAPVAPYIYADAANEARVADLIRQMVAGGVDAIAFTSSPQVQRLLQVAKAVDQEAPLRAALAGTTVAAVGPLVAETLRQADIRVDLMPSDSFFLKPLVSELASVLGPART